MAETMQSSAVELEQVQVMARRVIATKLAEDFAIPAEVTVERLLDYDQDYVVLTVRQRVLAQAMDKVMVYYPATWWDGFKARHFPGWLKAVFPVENASIEFDVRAYYPRIALPHDEHHVRIALHGLQPSNVHVTQQTERPSRDYGLRRVDGEGHGFIVSRYDALPVVKRRTHTHGPVAWLKRLDRALVERKLLP